MASATASRSPPEATIYARVGGVIRIVEPFKVSTNRMTTTWRSLRDDLDPLLSLRRNRQPVNQIDRRAMRVTGGFRSCGSPQAA